MNSLIRPIVALAGKGPFASSGQALRLREVARMRVTHFAQDDRVFRGQGFFIES